MTNQQHIWYPYTQMKRSGSPLLVLSGKGATLFGESGTMYIDAISSWWTNLHGHAHPYIAEKVYEQLLSLEHVIFAGFTHLPALRLAERLVKHLGEPFEKIFFSDNGSTSVEVAIKMSVQYWVNRGEPRKKIIAFQHAYHGDTFGSMSVSSRSIFTRPFDDLLFDVQLIPAPTPSNEVISVEMLRGALQSGDVCAFIYEPLVLGAGGMLMYTPDVLEEMIGITKSHGVICIADEVMTGFYRTGKMFATGYCKSKPDIICLSKGITGGAMALGVTAVTAQIFDSFYSDDHLKTFYHGHSYTGNPLACAAANASLDLIEEAEFSVRLKSLISRQEEFALRLKKFGNAENIRQTGTILAFDIITGSATEYLNPIRDKLYDYFIGKGILLRPLGNTIYILPPYCITDEELNKVYQSIEGALQIF